MDKSKELPADSEYPDKVYDTKRDTWIVVILYFIAFIGVAGAVIILFSGAPIYIIALQVILFLGMALFCISILRGTNYTLRGSELLVRSGPIRWTITIAGIEEVTPSRKVWSSAALSMDRLYIKHQKTSSNSYISPQEKKAFLEDLARRSPYLQFEIDRVLRIDSPMGSGNPGH